jgi:flagellin
MSVINTNVSSLIAQRSLAQNNSALNTSLERLSTGLRINTGADDPAGLIASQALQQEQTGIQTAISNASLAGNVIGTAEGGLNEVSSLLTQLQGLIGQAANTGGLSTDQVAADQLQVDSILSTINRIAGSTSFEGTQLLNGNMAYTTSSVGSAVTNLQVNSALVPDGGRVAVAVQVVSSGKTAVLTYAGGAISGNTVTLQVAGNLGSTQLSFASGTTVSSIATAINGVKNSTGLSAQVSGTDLRVNSTQYGSAQYASIQVISGTLKSSFSSTKAVGTDANITVNGASAEVNGLAVSYRNADLDISFNVLGALDKPSSSTFYITGGGATFQLGAEVNETNRASIGIQSVSTGDLGDSFNGYLSSIGSGGANNLSSDNLSTAQNILDSAISQVSTLRGRLGAFQTFTIGSTVNSLGVSYENVSAAESAITDTNFASETSNLTRDQILTQAATTVLSQANSRPDQVLTLLQNA